MYEKRKYQKPIPNPMMHHHCNQPEINININNNGEDDGISPAILDLINRINDIESDVKDLSNISGSVLELGVEEGQAYPGYKGLQNEVAISLLNKNLEDKADKDEIPDAEIYYLNSQEFPEQVGISGIYVSSKGITKYWSGSKWIDITLEHTNNIDLNSSDKEIPTAKAVFESINNNSEELENNFDKKLEYYVKDSEVINIIKTEIDKNESDEDEAYDSLLSSIIDFNNQIN